MIPLTEQEKRQEKDKYRKIQKAFHSAVSEAEKQQKIKRLY
jgi:hypothetical protein